MQSGEREEDCVARISDQRCSAAISWGIADGQAARDLQRGEDAI